MSSCQYQNTYWASRTDLISRIKQNLEVTHHNASWADPLINHSISTHNNFCALCNTVHVYPACKSEFECIWEVPSSAPVPCPVCYESLHSLPSSPLIQKSPRQQSPLAGQPVSNSSMESSSSSKIFPGNDCGCTSFIHSCDPLTFVPKPLTPHRSPTPEPEHWSDIHYIDRNVPPLDEGYWTPY